MSAALEAVLRRDRAIVIAALAIITMLAWTDLVWLANDMWMDGMDMTGFRMIPAGQGWMMPASAPWQADRVRLRFWDVGRHDDRHDDAFRSTHNTHLCARWSAGSHRRTAICGQRVVRRRLCAVVDGILSRSNINAMRRWNAPRCLPQ